MVDGCDVNYDLMLAVREGNLERTRELINTFGLSNGYVLLCEALEKKYISIAKLLLDCGCKVNSENSFYATFDTPLHYAVVCGDIEIVKIFLDKGAWIDAKTRSGKTPLQLAVEKGNLATVEYILKCCPDIENPSNRDSLKIAVYGYGETYKQVVEALLDYGFTVNPTDTNNRDFFETVIQKGYIKIVQDLLNQSAHYDTVLNTGGLTPLHIAVCKIANLLINYKADINAQDKSGETSLHIAVNYNQEGIVNLLISYKADINAQDETGDMPLHIAAINGNNKIAELLIRNGAKVDFRNKFSKTALHYACIFGRIEGVAALLEFGSDINNTCLLHLLKPPNEDALLGTGLPEYLVHHIAKMKVANLYISEKHLLIVNEKANYMIARSNFDENDFVDQCVRELERMKNEKIYDCTISFYDILTKGTNSLAVYMRNENVVKALKSTNYTIEFPLYASMIKSHFRKGMERKELLELGHRTFNSLFNNFADLPYGCTEKILSYLSNKDLENLINVYKSNCII